jgi:predicted DNA-binding transcriptional regulator AlpA
MEATTATPTETQTPRLIEACRAVGLPPRHRYRLTEVARLVGCTRPTLAVWVRHGRGPTVTRVSPRIAWVAAPELEAWLSARTMNAAG